MTAHACADIPPARILRALLTTPGLCRHGGPGERPAADLGCNTLCIVIGCTRTIKLGTQKCGRHAKHTRKRCSSSGCTSGAVDLSGKCTRHGGGRRCSADGCPSAAIGGFERCNRHGGGFPCNIAGCTSRAVSGSATCQRHAASWLAASALLDVHHGQAQAKESTAVAAAPDAPVAEGTPLSAAALATQGLPAALPHQGTAPSMMAAAQMAAAHMAAVQMTRLHDLHGLPFAVPGMFPPGKPKPGSMAGVLSRMPQPGMTPPGLTPGMPGFVHPSRTLSAGMVAGAPGFAELAGACGGLESLPGLAYLAASKSAPELVLAAVASGTVAGVAAFDAGEREAERVRLSAIVDVK